MSAESGDIGLEALIVTRYRSSWYVMRMGMWKLEERRCVGGHKRAVPLYRYLRTTLAYRLVPLSLAWEMTLIVTVDLLHVDKGNFIVLTIAMSPKMETPVSRGAGSSLCGTSETKNKRGL